LCLAPPSPTVLATLSSFVLKTKSSFEKRNQTIVVNCAQYRCYHAGVSHHGTLLLLQSMCFAAKIAENLGDVWALQSLLHFRRR